MFKVVKGFKKVDLKWVKKIFNIRNSKPDGINFEQ